VAALVAFALLAVSVLTLGIPNFGLAGQFMAGGYPSAASGVAVASMFLDGVLVGAAGVAAMCSVRGAAGGWVRRPSLSAMALVVVGAILLGLSVAQRVDSGGAYCCGGGPQQVREAASLAR
jgi:hypothetical protein